MSAIKVENLTVIYLDKKNNQFPVLTDFSCEFKDDCINIILGASGSGKTTLYKAICGLFNYDGNIYIDGVETSKIRRKDRHISYFSQDLFMFSHMIVYDILAYPLKREKYKPDEIDSMIKKIADDFQIKHLLTRKPDQLSIGQRQMVLLAKSLIKKPKICFLDEPFSNLDPQSIELAIKLIKEYKDNNKTTLYITTHNLKEVTPICDYLCYIKDGKCKYYGEYATTPDEILGECNLDNEQSN